MPHRSRWRPSIITAVAGILLAALLLAAVGYSLWRDRRDLNAAAADRQALVARVLEDHVGRSLDAAQVALAGLADVAYHGGTPEMLQALLGQTQASLGFLRGLALLDANGRVLAAADPADRGVQIAPAALGPWPTPGRDAIGGFIAGRGLATLNRRAVAATAPRGVGFIPVTRSLQMPDGRLLLLAALVNPDALANFRPLALGDEHSAAALVTTNGQLLAATDHADHFAGEQLASLLGPGSPLARLQRGDDQGRWDGPGLRPQAQLGAFRALRGRPFVVLVELPQAELRRLWLADVRDTGLPALALAAALLVLSNVGAAALRGRERSLLALDRALRQAADRERELSAIFGSVQDLLFRTDAAGRVTFINERYAQLSGFAVSHALGRPLPEFFGGSRALVALFEQTLGPDDLLPRHARADWTAPNGEARSFEVTLVPLRHRASALEWVGSATDVSGLMRAQSELRAQLGLARSLLASSPLPISVQDREGRYLDVNRAWEQLTGRKRADLLGRRALSDVDPGEARQLAASDAELFAHGGESHLETVWTDPSGQRRDLFISKSTFPGTDGRPMGLVVCLMDISEFRDAERATRAARDAALEASNAKSEFIANVSHELRTPLQSILGFSELGEMRARQDPRLAGMFADVHRAGERMLALVNDLLDLSRIEQSGEPLNLQRHDLRSLVNEIAAELHPLLQGRRLTLDCALGRVPLVAMVDAPRFQQVVRNVLANAIKFSPEGARIDVQARRSPDDRVLLDFADRGPGIPAAELENVFEAFVQSSATKDGAGGTGLGLAICRRIMLAHGGRIWAGNRDGGGAVLHLSLPGARFGDTSPAAL